MRRLFVCALLFLASACATTREQAHDDGAFAARKQLTRELVARGEWSNAFAHANDLHLMRPKDPDILVLRGTIYREKNLPGEAEADLRAALALSERSAEAHAALAILLDTSGRGAEAETHHKRAVELEPNSPAHLNNLGFSLLVRRKNKEAVELLQRAVRLDPTGRRVRTNLGFAYAATGDLARAATEFEMGGAPAEAKNNLGFAYEHRGDLPNAFTQYVAALKLDPSCQRARTNLVHVAALLKRPVPADLEPASTTSPARSAAPLAAPNQETTP
jgi:Flp pilus assembly protein TadD